MKKVIWKIVLLLCLTSFSLYGVQWNDLKDGETAEKFWMKMEKKQKLIK